LAGFTYDNNGNTTSKTDASGTTGYTWDFENRLTSVTLPGSGGTFSFTYDPFGRRIRIVSPSGTDVYAYDGDNIVDQMDATGTWQSRFTHGLGVDEPLEIRQQSVPLYYHADGLGSIAAVTNAARAVAASYVYDSFGQTTMQTQIVTSPYGFTGREFSNGDGNAPGPELYYYRARYYDPNVGRFLSEDPIGMVGGINFYVYTSNDPVRMIDPLGLVQITFDTSYTRLGFWESLWHAGETQLGKPELTATCDCVGGGRYKLNIGIRFPIRVYYSGSLNLSHEEKHVKVAEDFFRRQRGRYENFEQTYPSLLECEFFRQRNVTGFPNSGRTPDLMDAILRDADSGELGRLQDDVDSWFDILVFH
jgi:RHS repeat-associated protein